jgi:hypothetical protein
MVGGHFAVIHGDGAWSRRKPGVRCLAVSITKAMVRQEDSRSFVAGPPRG